MRVPRTYLWKSLSLILSACLLLSGCGGKGPESSLKVAQQGLLSAGLSADAGYALIGSLQHGGSLWVLGKNERLYNWNHEQGEFSTIRAVAMADDAKLAITAVDADLVVWNVSDGHSLNFWRAPDKISNIAIGPNDKYALLGMRSNQAVYFDLQKGQSRYEFPHKAEVTSVDISGDNRWAITGSDDQSARLWRLDTGALVHTFSHSNQVKTVALSNDGALAFSAAQREDAVIWDAISGDAKAKLSYRYENFTSARFSADGRRLLLGTFRGDIYLVDVANGNEIGYWSAKARRIWGPASSGAVLDMAFAANGEVIAITSDGMLERFKL
ncbi:hypothetical protein O5O45_28405 [Hahella aquimaris]|uniref:WD40 repeat domain-containing protein n=1 Tax=Hahella sp. HNIBRBA332 TaxID=3015983 RepID=UPI00273AE3DC|nr:hypothetical protein [Hahella sp. HNIBRBA332]WLQ13654.1 hypothetical protein O5O45_28405 [Hahella sp. HNIBRBA332]